jgi:hypothetical protein
MARRVHLLAKLATGSSHPCKRMDAGGGRLGVMGPSSCEAGYGAKVATVAILANGWTRGEANASGPSSCEAGYGAKVATVAILANGWTRGEANASGPSSCEAGYGAELATVAILAKGWTRGEANASGPSSCEAGYGARLATDLRFSLRKKRPDRCKPLRRGDRRRSWWNHYR